MLTCAGALAGGIIGLLVRGPMPPRQGEFDGLLYAIASFFFHAGGLIYFCVGALTGGAA